MKLSELAVLFGIFLLVFYSAVNFISSFHLQQALPPEIEKAWNSSYQQVEEMKKIVGERAEKTKEAGLFEQIKENISMALGLVHFIALSLWSVFVSIPMAVFGGITYLGSRFGIDPIIITVITALIGIVIVIKAIEFITGRSGL